MKRIIILALGIGLAVRATEVRCLASVMEQSVPAEHAELAKIFQRGQMALQQGDLEAAEMDFRRVLQSDPRAAAAYVNLGVIEMRRKNWDKALAELRHAENAGYPVEHWTGRIQARQLSRCDCAAIRCHAGPAGGGTAALLAGLVLFVCGAARGCRENAGAAVAANVGSVRLPLCARDFGILFRGQRAGPNSVAAIGGSGRRHASVSFADGEGAAQPQR